MFKVSFKRKAGDVEMYVVAPDARTAWMLWYLINGHVYEVVVSSVRTGEVWNGSDGLRGVEGIG